MGLDMYLEARRYVSAWEDPQGYHSVRSLFPVNTDEGVEFKNAYVTMKVGYWRKANAIHKWFVDNVQEGEDKCEEHLVSQQHFEKLRDELVKALDNKDPEAFPPEDGFFFGSTEIDEYYWDDMKQTLDVTRKVLEIMRQETEKNLRYLNRTEFYYRSSW